MLNYKHVIGVELVFGAYTRGMAHHHSIESINYIDFAIFDGVFGTIFTAVYTVSLPLYSMMICNLSNIHYIRTCRHKI